MYVLKLELEIINMLLKSCDMYTNEYYMYLKYEQYLIECIELCSSIKKES